MRGASLHPWAKIRRRFAAERPYCTCPSVSTSARRAGRKVGRHPRLSLRAPQSTKTRRSVTLKQNNPMFLYFNHLHPSTPSQGPEKPGPACYNTNRRSQGTNVLRRRNNKSELSNGGDGVRWGNARWRASPDVPCRHSWRHLLAARPQPHVGAKPAMQSSPHSRGA